MVNVCMFSKYEYSIKNKIYKRSNIQMCDPVMGIISYIVLYSLTAPKGYGYAFINRIILYNITYSISAAWI